MDNSCSLEFKGLVFSFVLSLCLECGHARVEDSVWWSGTGGVCRPGLLGLALACSGLKRGHWE